jgi:hypothetical protein
VRSGEGAAVVVEGPAGIGKTRLLEVAVFLAEEGGLSVLAAGGNQLEREVGYGVVRQLFEAPLARLSAGEREECSQGQQDWRERRSSRPSTPVLSPPARCSTGSTG